MNTAYPVLLTPIEDMYAVYIPDFDIATQGKDLADAIHMARDAMGEMGISMEEPPTVSKEPDFSKLDFDIADSILTWVDIDFEAYRKRCDNRTERRNVTLPQWLNALAKQKKVNVSEVLTEALKEKLGAKRNMNIKANDSMDFESIKDMPELIEMIESPEYASYYYNVRVYDYNALLDSTLERNYKEYEAQKKGKEATLYCFGDKRREKINVVDVSIYNNGYSVSGNYVDEKAGKSSPGLNVPLREYAREVGKSLPDRITSALRFWCSQCPSKN